MRSLLFVFAFLFTLASQAHNHRVLVLAERGGGHAEFTTAAIQWLEGQQQTFDMDITLVEDAKTLKAKDITRHDLIIQLNYPPYAWSKEAMRAFERYIDKGKGAYIGFHHASLLGEFDGYGLWEWYSDFLGGIQFKSYIPQLADGTVHVEDAQHPVMKGLPSSFVLERDEWYTYDKNPREHAHVLANVDEASYRDCDDAPQWGPKAYHPMPTMGDHPVIWTNPSKAARNVYFQFGHDKSLLSNPAFVLMLKNALAWTLE